LSDVAIGLSAPAAHGTTPGLPGTTAAGSGTAPPHGAATGLSCKAQGSAAGLPGTAAVDGATIGRS
jgi:hypothetical protein